MVQAHRCRPGVGGRPRPLDRRRRHDARNHADHPLGGGLEGLAQPPATRRRLGEQGLHHEEHLLRGARRPNLVVLRVLGQQARREDGGAQDWKQANGWGCRLPYEGVPVPLHHARRDLTRHLPLEFRQRRANEPERGSFLKKLDHLRVLLWDLVHQGHGTC